MCMQAIGTTSETTTGSATPKRYANKAVYDQQHLSEHTAIEMTGTDRPGLFSEISAALAQLHCNVVEAHAWSHNDRLACVAYVSDQSTGSPIADPNRLALIEFHLSNVLRATTEKSPSETHINPVPQEVKSPGGDGTLKTDVERRLHQLMLSVRDFDGPDEPVSLSTMIGLGSNSDEEGGRKTVVSIESCDEKGYSIVSVECKDRPRLMFDTVCTLTDMQYVVFHASVGSRSGYAFQVYVCVYIFFNVPPPNNFSAISFLLYLNFFFTGILHTTCRRVCPQHRK